MSTLLLSQQDIKNLIAMKDIVEICDKTYQGHGEGTVVNPTKVSLDLGEVADFPKYGGNFNAMPAYIGWQDMAGIKWAGGLKTRVASGLPYITSMILLIDFPNGNFVAAMDGEWITAMRTGAQSACALKYMLGAGKKITLGLCGAGAQGHTQVLAVSQWFDIEELRVYDIKKEASERLAANMKDAARKIVICDKSGDVCRGADAVICVTHSREPLITYKDVAPGTVVLPLGSFKEVDDEYILNCDKIVVDHVGQTLHRGCLSWVASEHALTEDDLFGTLGELACGKKSVGDVKNQRIICVPIGMGCMDVATAVEVYRRAKEKGIGGDFSFV